MRTAPSRDVVSWALRKADETCAKHEVGFSEAGVMGEGARRSGYNPLRLVDVVRWTLGERSELPNPRGGDRPLLMSDSNHIWGKALSMIS